MSDQNTERMILTSGSEVVGREVNGSWQVQVVDKNHRIKPANAAVTEAFDKLMIARIAASRAGNEWGTQLGILIHYAERAGFNMDQIEPEAIDTKLLNRMAQNPGLKPYVDNVKSAMKMKDQFDLMERQSADKLEIAVDHQFSGRSASVPKISQNDIEQLNGSLPNLRSSGVQKG